MSVLIFDVRFNKFMSAIRFKLSFKQTKKKMSDKNFKSNPANFKSFRKIPAQNKKGLKKCQKKILSLIRKISKASKKF